MKQLLLAVAAIILFTACGKDTKNDEYRLSLQKKIQGRYKLISCKSNQPLDLNNDGISSTNLITENSMILMSEVELKVIIPSIYLNDNEFTLSESWPIENQSRLAYSQAIASPIPPVYNSYYNLYCTSSIACIYKDHKTIKLINDIDASSNGTLQSIESIAFDDDKVVSITSVRSFYTNGKGWVTATIESSYKHYTSAS